MLKLRKLLGTIMDKDRIQSENSVDDNGKIIIYKTELNYLSKCILELSLMGKGGNLFGLWTPFGIPFIQYVVGPDKDAEHHYTHFRQDFDFLDKNADFLVKKHVLHHTGTWHSHYSLDLNGDTRSTLSGMKECHLRSFPADRKLSSWKIHCATPREYIIPQTTKYYCMARTALNVRSASNPSTRVISACKSNQIVDVYEITNGFAKI